MWSQEAQERIGSGAARSLLASDHELFVATVSTLEIARLIAAGRIVLQGALGLWVTRSLESLRCGTIELSHAIATEAYALPGSFHDDPADRILVATARAHDLTMVTADERILRYRHVRTRDARK